MDAGCTFEHHPRTSGVRVTHELGVILPKRRHGRHDVPVVGAPRFAAHVKHKHLHSMRTSHGHPSSLRP